MKTASVPIPTAISREAIGHIFYCVACRDWRHHEFALLDNDNLEKKCQKCGRAVEFVYRAQTWLPIPVERVVGKYVDKRLAEAEAKYAAKLKGKDEGEPPEKSVKKSHRKFRAFMLGGKDTDEFDGGLDGLSRTARGG